MKWLLLLVAISGSVAIAIKPNSVEPDALLIIGGDTRGNLSPCGCTKPMSGGIRRRITLMKQLSAGKNAALVENGGLVSGAGAQDQLKAEALAEAFAHARFAAVNLGYAEAKLGAGGVTGILNLMGPIGLVSTIGDGGRLNLVRVIVKRPFAIAGLDVNSDDVSSQLGEPKRTQKAAIDELLEAASDDDLIPVLLFQGGLDAAKRLPRVGEVKVVVFSSTGAPNAKPIAIGNTLFVSPGEKGKSVVSLSFSNNEFRSMKAYSLPPDIADDRETNGIYSRYLERVISERLLEKLPRVTSAAFSGSAKCGSCHAKALKVWKGSSHAGALHTLELDKHGRDPDCVGCHVVGLTSKGGFRSRAATPQLANVGCESCHGAGAKHSSAPYKFKMPKMGQKVCSPCHVPDHSPGFSFKTYWPKIKH